MSWEVPRRPNGTSVVRWVSSSGLSVAADSMGVSTGPGWIELQRMPSAAYWMAVVLVKVRTAPLEAL